MPDGTNESRGGTSGANEEKFWDTHHGGDLHRDSDGELLPAYDRISRQHGGHGRHQAVSSQLPKLRKGDLPF